MTPSSSPGSRKISNDVACPGSAVTMRLEDGALAVHVRDHADQVRHFEQRDERVVHLGREQDPPAPVHRIGERLLLDLGREARRGRARGRPLGEQHRVGRGDLRRSDGAPAGVGLVDGRVRMMLSDEAEVGRADVGPDRIRSDPQHLTGFGDVHRVIVACREPSGPPGSGHEAHSMRCRDE